MEQKQRDRALDVLRGFAIMLVILGHMKLTPTVIRAWLYSFHMPLFFLCSGVLFRIDRYKSYGGFVRSKLRSLVLPYFCLGVTLWLLKCLRQVIAGLLSGAPAAVNWDPSHMLLSLLLGYRLHDYYFSLWFLCALFIGELIFYFIVRYGKDNRYIFAGAVVVFIALQWLVFRVVNGWFWSLDLVPACVAFLSLGYLVQLLKKNGIRYTRKWMLLPAVAGSLVFGLLNYRVCGTTDLYRCNIGNPLYYGLAAIFGSWAILIACDQIGQLNVVEYFGRNSLVTYAYQNSFAIPLSMDIAGWLAGKSELLDDRTFQWVFVFCLTLFISALLIEAINRFFPFFIGKTRAVGRGKQAG